MGSQGQGTATSGTPLTTLIMESDVPDKDLHSVSSWLLYAAVKKAAGEGVIIKRLRNGTVLLKATKQVVGKLLGLSTLEGQVPIKVSLHKTLNNVRGLVRCYYLATVTPEEAQGFLVNQKITDVRKLSKGTATGPPAFLLTFDCTVLPRTITILDPDYVVKPAYHVPNPPCGIIVVY